MKAYGEGLESGKPIAGHPVQFTVDCRDAGDEAPLEIVCQSADGEEVPVDVKDNGDGTYTVQYTPREPIKHTIIPHYDGVAIKNAPFRVSRFKNFNLIKSKV